MRTLRLRTLKICNNPFRDIKSLSEMFLGNVESLVIENEHPRLKRFINFWELAKF